MNKDVNEALEKLYNEVIMSNRQYRFILDRDKVLALVEAWKAHQQGDSITMPQSADQAELMQKTGYAWLRDNAPERLTQQDQGEPVAWLHIQGSHTEASDRPLDSEETARGWSQKPLYEHPPAPAAVPNDYRDAYEGAREDLLHWKNRALKAEAETRKSQQAQGEAVAWRVTDPERGKSFVLELNDPEKYQENYPEFLLEKCVIANPAPAAVPEETVEVTDEMVSAARAWLYVGACREHVQALWDALRSAAPAPSEPESELEADDLHYAMRLLQKMNGTFGLHNPNDDDRAWFRESLRLVEQYKRKLGVGQCEALPVTREKVDVDEQQAALFRDHNGAED